MHDQSPTILSSISKLEEGLKTYGLLKSIREHPLMGTSVCLRKCPQFNSYSFS